MNYIVLDLKWSLSGNTSRKDRELDQIGAVMVDEKLNILDKFYADLRSGKEFESVMEKFRSWCGNCPFVVWGRNDIIDLDLDWMPEVFDAQEIFDDQVTMQGRQFDLNYAVMKFGEKPLRGTNALYITMGIVKVLRNLSFIRGIDMQRGMYCLEAV